MRRDRFLRAIAVALPRTRARLQLLGLQRPPPTTLCLRGRIIDEIRSGEYIFWHRQAH